MSTGRIGSIFSTASGATRLRGGRMAPRDRAISRRAEGSLIGLDLAPTSRPSRPVPKQLAPLLCIAIVAALGLAALRMDVLRTGYALTEAHREELRLREELRSLSVALQELRAPAMLRQRAAELGFIRPSHLIDLGAPSVASRLAARGPVATGSAHASRPTHSDEVIEEIAVGGAVAVPPDPRPAEARP